MDDFVKKAFENATESAIREEANEFENRIAKKMEQISTACGFVVGLPEMEKLSKAVVLSGTMETFAEWTRTVMLVAFSEGFDAARFMGVVDK